MGSEFRLELRAFKGCRVWGIQGFWVKVEGVEGVREGLGFGSVFSGATSFKPQALSPQP